jgi:hypothetical protein
MPSYTPDTETLRGEMPESTGQILTLEQREADAVKYIIEKLEAIGRQLQAMDYPVVAGHCTTAAYMLVEDGK